MLAVNYSSLRSNMKSYLDRVTEDAETLLITRRSDRSVVAISEERYEIMQEGLHLLGSYANYTWLMQSLAQLQAGQVHSLRLEDLARPVTLSENAWQDYTFWQAEDGKTLQKLNGLLEDIAPGGNAGFGRPRPLQGDLRGCWSRRLNEDDRLVYRTSAAGLELLACRFHDA